MFRLVRECRVLAIAFQRSTCLRCTPSVFTSASLSTMETFRQRKAIEGRAVTRSYTVDAIKAHNLQVATDTSTSVFSGKKRPATSDAAPRKQRSSKATIAKQVLAAAGPKDAVNAAHQPRKPAKTARKPAAAKKLSREKASTSSQTSTDTAILRTTADIDTAEPSNRALDASPATDMQAAPSGMPSSIPSGLPADPAVLHCWTKESLAEATKYLAARDPGQSAPHDHCLASILKSWNPLYVSAFSHLIKLQTHTVSCAANALPPEPHSSVAVHFSFLSAR